MQNYGGTQRPPPQKLTPLFPRKLTGKERSEFVGRWPLCTTVQNGIRHAPADNES